ncbi:unnamed protein product, partial [marine sediment metagenome]
GILVLSASGGGWIAATAGIFIVLLYHRVKTFWGTSLASVVAVGATLPIWYNTTWIKAVFPIQSLLDRVERWQATIAALKDYPLAGLGLGGWWSKVSTFGMLGGPHNAYLQLYSDTGALGMIALVLAVIISVKLSRQILYADKDSPIYGITAGITAGLIAGGIHALIDDNMNALIQVGNDYLYYAIPLLWLWAALLVVSCQRLLRNTEKDWGRRGGGLFWSGGSSWLFCLAGANLTTEGFSGAAVTPQPWALSKKVNIIPAGSRENSFR